MFDDRVAMPQSEEQAQFDFTLEGVLADADEEAFVAGLVSKSNEAFYRSLVRAWPAPALPRGKGDIATGELIFTIV